MSIRLVAVLWIAAAMFAQQADVAPAPVTFRIAGVVVDNTSGAALGKTRVMLAPTTARAEVRRFITSNDGRFAFDKLPAGKYSLAAERRGYPGQAFDFHDSYATAIVTGPELDTEHLVFRLKPAASITGRITDEFDEPQQDISVMLFYSGVLGGTTITRLVRTLKSDDLGVYRIMGLPAGRYYVAVSGHPWYAQYVALGRQDEPDEPVHANHPRKRSALEAAYPIMFYPGVAGSANATPIVLKFGEHFTADIQLHAVPSIHVRLKGEGPFGAAEFRQRLFNTVEVRVEGADTNANDEGEWEIAGLPPGRYIVQVQQQGASVFRSEVEWLSDTVVDVQSLAAEPAAATLSGSIKFEGKLEAGRKPDLLLRNISTGALHSQSIGADGSFRFSEGIALGTYDVGIGNAPGFFVWGIAAAGATVNGTRMEILRAQAVQLSVVATRSVGTVEGIAVRDAKAMAGAMIVLVPQNLSDLPLYRRDQSDSDGTFTLPSVLPGQYTVIALRSWEVEWSNPEVLRKYLPTGENIGVTGNEKARVRVAVQ